MLRYSLLTSEDLKHMSFIISKIVWALLTPGSILLLMLALAWWLHGRRPALSRGLLAVATISVATLLLCPIGAWILRPLESRFPPMPMEQRRVDGIIVLGGALEPEATERIGLPILNNAAERLTTFVALARAYPEAKLVFSGGSGDPLRSHFREADYVKKFFESQGLAADRVIFERDSRNTYENAAYSKNLIQPQPHQNWLLLTSAWHMPRAIGCFEKIGWKVTPYPVDYRSTGYDHWMQFRPDQQFEMVTTGIHEWVGLISYRMMGYIN